LLPLSARPGSWARGAAASDPARARAREALQAGAAPSAAARSRELTTAGVGGPGAIPGHRTAMLRVRGGAGDTPSWTEAAGDAPAALASLAAADTAPTAGDSATAGGAVSAAAPPARGCGKARQPRPAHCFMGWGACSRCGLGVQHLCLVRRTLLRRCKGWQLRRAVQCAFE